MSSYKYHCICPKCGHSYSAPALTKRQFQLWEFMKKIQLKTGEPPSTREMANHMDITHKAVFGHLEAMETKGVVEHIPHQGKGPPTKCWRALI